VERNEGLKRSDAHLVPRGRGADNSSIPGRPGTSPLATSPNDTLGAQGAAGCVLDIWTIESKGRAQSEGGRRCVRVEACARTVRPVSGSKKETPR